MSIASEILSPSSDVHSALRSERLFSIPIFGPTQARHKIRILPLNLRNLARLSPAMRAACQKGLIWIAPSVVARARFAL